MRLFKKKNAPTIYDIAVRDFRLAIAEKKSAEQHFNYADEEFIDCAIMELDIAERAVSLAHKKAELSMNY